ncbi:MAG: hypothetical protein IJW28_01915 [Clostridia bacterium]|nr:hypothetical protein [Clostridia bacterium]
MDEELLKIVYEIIQNTGYIAKTLINSEIAMNDGDVAASQKYTKEAQNLLNSTINDNFKEYRESVNVQTDSTNEYDIPTTLELAKQIASLEYTAGMLLCTTLDNQNMIIENLTKKLLIDINTIEEIYNAIYNN